MEEMRYIIGGHQLARASMGTSAILASRPFIEGHVRRRVRELTHVTLIDECDVLGVTTSGDDQRVAGVRIRHHDDGNPDELLATDLVVAATGRSARIPAWLAALGYPTPEEERLDIGVSYASQRLSLSPDSLSGDKLVLIGARPGRPRALFLFAEEGGRWILGLAGYGPGHHPPADPEGFAAFAASVAPADVLEAIQTAQPLAEIATHGFPASLRRRYDRLRSFPAGLLVIGDAICSFHPTYGQGMTVAAAEAVTLRDCLARGTRDLARRFFSAASRPIDDAWELSVGADLALPEIKARRPARVRLTNAYLRRLRATAEHDPAVAAAFIAVVGMLERPPHVLRPAIAYRVARGPRRSIYLHDGNPPTSTRLDDPTTRLTAEKSTEAQSAEAAMINQAATIPLPTAKNATTVLSDDAKPTMPHSIPDAMSVHRATSATVRNRDTRR